MRDYMMRWLGLGWHLHSGVKVQIRNQAEWCTYNDLFVDGEYDEAINLTLDEITGTAEEALIFDLGANVGYFSLRFVDLYSRRELKQPSLYFTMIEGSATLCEQIRERLAGVPAKIEVLHGLAGKKTGFALLREERSHVKSRVVQGGKASRVDYIDLNKIVPVGRRICLLKCDIEGSEFDLIANYGELLARVDRAIFEFHHDAGETAAAIRELVSIGFTHECLRTAPSYSTHFFCR